MLLAMAEYKRNKRKPYPYNKQTYTHKPLRETQICRSISTAISSTILKVTKFHKTRHHKAMSPALHVLYIPPSPYEAPQLVRLARKGLSRTIVFLHPNGELYELPGCGELKSYERDCGPSTQPVFGGKRACEGGCCAWFTTDAGEDEVLDYVQAGNEVSRQPSTGSPFEIPSPFEVLLSVWRSDADSALCSGREAKKGAVFGEAWRTRV